MTIIRDGKEITLTQDELCKAYFEQQFYFDQDDVRTLFDSFDDEDLMDNYGMTREQLESLTEDIAVEMRRNIDKYDMDWYYARDEAVRDVIYREHA